MPLQAATASEPCNPVSYKTCALPWPSNFFTRPDASRSTGVRVNIPRESIREELLLDVPRSLDVQRIFNTSDGFSAASAVIFELDQQPDPQALPADGGELVGAWDLDTGERIPVRAQINLYARSNKVSAPANILEVFPRSRWRFGARIVVAVSSSLSSRSGQSFSTSTGFARVLSEPSEAARLGYTDALSLLESRGWVRERLLSATVFTTRSEASATLPMRGLMTQALESPHPIRNVQTFYQAVGPIAAYVKGEVQVLDFRNADGLVEYERTPAAKWLRFRLSLPRNTGGKPVPVALFGHGITVVKETDVTVSLTNARKGFATLSIDQPNHGTRSREDGGYVLNLMSTPHVGRLLGMMAQSPVDFMSLYQAARTSFAALDVLPRNRHTGPGDGIPDLDTSNIYYQGTSLGGVLGTTFVSLAPELRGAFLHVTGVGITSILSNSTLWMPLFSRLEPRKADGAEALLLRAAIQHEIDYGDSINFVHYLREPPAGVNTKPVAITIVKGDRIVTNESSIALAEIARLPLVGEERFPMPGTTRNPSYVDGYGIRQITPLPYAIGSLGPHGAFIKASVSRDQGEWLDLVRP